jgi:hypothetical protein
MKQVCIAIFCTIASSLVVPAFSQDRQIASQWDEMNSLDQVKFVKSFLATQGNTDASLLEKQIPEIANCMDNKVRNDKYKNLPLNDVAAVCYNVK